MARRFQKLYAQSASDPETLLYADFVRITLEIIATSVVAGVQNNPHLIYTLLHKREIFGPLRIHTHFEDSVNAIDEVLRFYNSFFIVCLTLLFLYYVTLIFLIEKERSFSLSFSVAIFKLYSLEYTIYVLSLQVLEHFQQHLNELHSENMQYQVVFAAVESFGRHFNKQSLSVGVRRSTE